MAGRKSPSQARAKKKVSRILDTVEALAARGQLGELTTNRVAEQTGYSIGTIYQYFADRADMIVSAELRMCERMVDSIADDLYCAISGSEDDVIEKFIGIYIENARSQPGYVQLLQFTIQSKSQGMNMSRADEYVGDFVAMFARAKAPEINDDQIEAVRTILVNIVAALVDVILLAESPQMARLIQNQLVAHCKFAIRQMEEQVNL